MSESALLEALGQEDAPVISLTQRAYRKLEELIVTLQLRPGEVLSETALAQRLEIGRTPIREALQRQAREGLVVILPRRGILVSELDVRRQLKLLELRRELERLMARAASRRASKEERLAFLRISEGMRQAAEQEDEITFMRFDSKLNLLLCRAARNEFVANAMSLTHGLSRRFWFQHHKEVGDLALCAYLHADLSAAVAKGMPEEAAGASDKLLDYVESFTRATLDSEG
ncbi:MAG: GntR family transcriptional regulator [Rhodovibrionaceae bacterium]